MQKFFWQFSKNEDAAITVDWVVLTAIAVALALLVMAAFTEVADISVNKITDGIETNLN